MKQVKVTILVDIDQDVYDDFLATGISQAEILNDVKLSFNGRKLSCGLVQDFEVESVEVKA
jgi:hypothetical protein